MIRLEEICNLEDITLEMQKELERFKAKYPNDIDRIGNAQRRIDEINRIARIMTGALLNHGTFMRQLEEQQYYLNQALMALKKLQQDEQ